MNRRDFLTLLAVSSLSHLFSGCTKREEDLVWTSINVCDERQQGDAHLIIKNGKYYLIDGGHYDLAKTHLLPYFEKKQIRKLDGVMLNHPHSDHYGGIFALYKEGIKIDTLFMNMPTHEQMIREPLGGQYKHLLELQDLAKKANTEIKPIIQGDRFYFDQGSYLEILYIYDGIHTPVGETDINGMSAVTMIVDGKNRFLLTGDLSWKIGDYLADHAENLKADILKAPHHGTDPLAPNRFFDKVNASDLIVTSPKNLWFSKRSRRMREYAKKHQYNTYVNGIHGHITVTSRKNRYTITTEQTFGSDIYTHPTTKAEFPCITPPEK